MTIFNPTQDRFYTAQECPDWLYARTDGWRSTQIATAARSTLSHLEIPREPKRAFDIGSAVHTLLLEPERWNERYLVEPQWQYDGRTKDGRAERKAFRAQKEQFQKILTAADGEYVSRLAASVMCKPRASELILEARQNQRVENSLWWTDPKSGLTCKLRLDGWCPGIIFDIKTSKDASPRAFMGSIRRYGYHISAAHYMSGAVDLVNPTGRVAFIYIVVEKTAIGPQHVALYELDRAALELGAQIRADVLGQLARTQDLSTVGYPDDVQIVTV